MQKPIFIIMLTMVVMNPISAPAHFQPENALLFALGAGSSIGIHETSHYLAARVQGLDVKPHGLGWDVDRPTTAFQMAGLAGNALSSEAILLLTEDSRGPFLNGWLLTNILEQLTYSTLRISDRRSDFGPLSKSKRCFFAAVFITEALLAGYRMHRDGQLSISVWFTE